ncbi:hypothetical protein SDC9_07438 [bioreactor metagenome]|uniref:YopX protein domain-containing protein n=1 Tax=bioreactor metagenome TaxID=1076179 RepID=A0A644T509_9ZZZZ|nr:YopX family protein [Methanobrevibacter sp.]MEA4956894.1 YopX family protein [Methanobrevibacter sp.]
MKPEEVKFKAKLKGIKKLVKVMRLDFEEKHIIINTGTFNEPRYLVFKFEDVEQLLQWTGFKDKEGNEIYDGTNFKYDNNLYIVKRLKNGGFWAIDQRPNMKGFPLNSGETGFSVVVGNVYEED